MAIAWELMYEVKRWCLDREIDRWNDRWIAK